MTSAAAMVESDRQRPLPPSSVVQCAEPRGGAHVRPLVRARKSPRPRRGGAMGGTHPLEKKRERGGIRWRG
eukprot:5846513-Pyramimonas_sp.AAC.1